MKLSIIIVAWNSSATLARCVNAVLDQVRSMEFEILVVDNASSDKGYLAAYRNHDKVILVENPGNWGFARANNIGFARARGEFILILNPDVYLISDPFPRLLSALAANPDLAAIGPMLVEESGAPQVVGYYYKFPTVLQTLLVRTWLTRMAFIRALALKYCHSAIQPAGLSRVDQIPGAFLLFHRASIPGPEILKEAYFIWMEDVDFCRRIADSGRHVAVLGDEKAIHVGGTTFKMWTTQRKVKTAFISYATYLRIHHGPVRYLTDHLILLSNYAFVLAVVATRDAARLRFRDFTATVRSHAEILGTILRSMPRFPR